jgi:hypothetical protein
MHAWPPTDVPPSDWIGVSLICLAPLQRAVLDVLVAAGGPVRPRDLPRLGSKKRMLDCLFKLWTLKIVTRDRQKECVIYYQIIPSVIPIAARYPSLSGRGGRHCDPTDGCAILKAARDLVADRTWPGYRQLARESGVPGSSTLCWARRLKSVGLWPDTTGLTQRDAQAATRRLIGIKNRQHAKLAVPDVAPWGRPRRGRVSGIGGEM